MWRLERYGIKHCSHSLPSMSVSGTASPNALHSLYASQRSPSIMLASPPCFMEGDRLMCVRLELCLEEYSLPLPSISIACTAASSFTPWVSLFDRCSGG